MAKEKRKKLYTVISCLLCLALTLGCVFGASRLLERKTSRRTYDTFKRIGGDLDVLFLGSSHVWDGIFPMEMYKDYGIAGYIIGYSAYRLPMDYWALAEAYRYSNPRLLVMDVYIMTEVALSNNDASLHTLFDAYPSDAMKYKALKELDHTLEGDTNKLDLMFDLYGYHSRWNDLQKQDFEDYNNVLRGANRTYKIAEVGELPADLPRDVITDDYNLSMEYLERIIQLAQSHGTEVLLTLVPQPCTEEAQPYYNWCYTLDEKYGLTYLDMTEIEGLVDYETDLYDYLTAEYRRSGAIEKGTFVEGSIYDNSAHLNVSGAYKVTGWLGNYLIENYDLPDRRGCAGYEYWDEDYETWMEQIVEELNAINDMDVFLMAAYNDNFRVDLVPTGSDMRVNVYRVDTGECVAAKVF